MIMPILANQLRHNVLEGSEEEVAAVHDVELVNIVDKHHAEIEEPDSHHQLVPDALLLID